MMKATRNISIGMLAVDKIGSKLTNKWGLIWEAGHRH